MVPMIVLLASRLFSHYAALPTTRGPLAAASNIGPLGVVNGKGSPALCALCLLRVLLEK